jgi:hypothetical protein
VVVRTAAKSRGPTLATARDDDASEIDIEPSRVQRRRHGDRGFAGPDHDAATSGFSGR